MKRLCWLLLLAASVLRAQVLSDDQVRTTLIQPDATLVGLTIEANASQTEDLVSMDNSSAVEMFRMDASGDICSSEAVSLGVMTVDSRAQLYVEGTKSGITHSLILRGAGIDPMDLGSGPIIWLRSEELEAEAAAESVSDGQELTSATFRWDDASGHGNHFTQPSAGVKLLFQENVLSGLSAVEVDPLDVLFVPPEMSGDIDLGITWTIAALYRTGTGAGTANVRILGTNTSTVRGTAFPGRNSSATADLAVGPPPGSVSGSIANAFSNADGYHIGIARLTSGTSAYYHDCVSIGNGDSGYANGSTMPQRALLQNSNATTSPAGAQLVELLVYSTSLSSGDVSLLCSYLSARQAGSGGSDVVDLILAEDSSGTDTGEMTSAGALALGRADPEAKLHVESTTTQERLGYSDAVYCDTAVDSSGNAAATCTGSTYTFADDIDCTTCIETTDIGASQVTYAKIQNGTARSVLGRSANSSGVLADIAGTGASTILSDDASTLAFRSISALGIAPNTPDYLVGTADGGLTNEIVVGTTPGGELGGTWAAPTIDDGVTVLNWTLTTPTITSPTLDLTQSTNPTPTTEGRIEWETDDDHIIIGDGAAGSAEFCPAEDFTTDIAVTDACSATINSNAVQGTDIALASEATGSLMYHNGTDWVPLAIGTNTQILGVNAGATAPEWETDDVLSSPSFSFTIAGPDTADNFILSKLQNSITVTDIHCIVQGGTSAVIDMQERTSAGASPATLDAAITCDTDGAEDDGSLSNGGLDAGDWLSVDMGAVSGAVTSVTVTLYYTVP